MTYQSSRELLMLHAVRLAGFADSRAVAQQFGTPHEATQQMLSNAERAGWVQHMAFADLEGWSLTEVGKAENERELAAERSDADTAGVIPSVYRSFLPLNARLLQAVTDWQMKPTTTDQFALNDHSDHAWDQRILDELVAIGQALAPLTELLATVLARFDGYQARYESALDKARCGQHDWIDKTDVDSCHRVWFQLHEDLIATLGIDRGTEA